MYARGGKGTLASQWVTSDTGHQEKGNTGKTRNPVQKQRSGPSRKETHPRGTEVSVHRHPISHQHWGPLTRRLGIHQLGNQPESHKRKEHTAAGFSVRRERYRWFCLHLNYSSFSSYKFIYFIYLFLAALGLRCCTRAFSSCGKRGLLFVVVHGLLIVVASLVAEHGL